MHRHNPLPPLLLIIQRNCRRHHHHQRRHRKEPPLQHHHYYCRRQHLLSKPSDIIFSNAPIFFRPIDKLLSQLHYDLFIVSSFVIIINRIIESGCRCIDIIIIIIIGPRGPRVVQRTGGRRRRLILYSIISAFFCLQNSTGIHVGIDTLLF